MSSSVERNKEMRRLRGAIELQYLAIGKKYFNDHISDNANEYKEEMEQINIAMQRLKELEAVRKDMRKSPDVTKGEKTK